MKIILQIGLLVAMMIFALSRSYAECQISESFPPGNANQGGYVFHYQSGKGKDCRGYLLWNSPGKVMTPVLWKDENETFFDVNLPDCPAGSKCPELEVIKISAQPTMKDKTTLSYGFNKDEYKDKPDAYREKLAKSEKKKNTLTTIIRGILADAQNNALPVAIQVSSMVKGEKPFKLTYEISMIGKSVPLQILKSGILPENPSAPGLIWKAAESELFFKNLQEQGIKELSPKEEIIVVNIEAMEIEVEKSSLLELVQNGKRIFATTASAYRPKE